MFRWMTRTRGHYEAPVPIRIGPPGRRVEVIKLEPGRWRVAVLQGRQRLWRCVIPAHGWSQARMRAEGLVQHRALPRGRMSLGPMIPPRRVEGPAHGREVDQAPLEAHCAENTSVRASPGPRARSRSSASGPSSFSSHQPCTGSAAPSISAVKPSQDPVP